MNPLYNYDCPQYVNFVAEFRNDDDSFAGSEASSCSIKTDMEQNSMNVDEFGSSYAHDEISESGSMHSTLSESYLAADSSCKESIRESEYRTEDFPVHRPENSSLPERNQKRDVQNKTKIRSFHLTEPKKRKREDEHIPLAEQIAAFHKKTPQRFHTTGPKAYEPMEHWSPQMIVPKSPNLQAAKRHRGVKVLSREEQEAKEEEEMKRYRFRARPVKYNVLHNHQLPTVGKKLPTKPRNLLLRTAQRAAEINAKKKEEEKPFEFHARPVPKSILSGPTGLKEKSALPVTQAKTPTFALKSREQKWKRDNKVDALPETQKFKAIPAPAPTSPFVVQHEKKRTEIQPFSFDMKDKERMAKKEKKIAEEIEKENRVYVFKAQPMPSPVPSGLPAVEKKPATHPVPFSFLSDSRSSKQNSFNLSTDHVYPGFKAQPATVLEKPPFIPEKSMKLPVEVKEFQLYTDIRASERQKLKEINDIKEHEKELALERLRQLEEENERKEVLKIRKEAVHKANPVRHYKPVEIKPSNKLPTQPLSPKFHTDERLQSRHQV